MNDLIEILVQYKKDNPDDKLLLSKTNILIEVAKKLNAINQLNPIDQIAILPDAETGYFEYRVMNDTETEDRTLWQEYKQGNFRLTPGDWLVKLK